MNEVTVFRPDGAEKLPRMSKAALAARLVRIVAAAFQPAPLSTRQ